MSFFSSTTPGVVTFRVDKDTITTKLEELRAAAKRPRAIMAAATRAVYNALRKHFRRLDAENPNQLGGERQHFWRQVERSVNTPIITDSTGLIVISDPRLPQKVFGGTITPKRVRFLTIPVSAAAYGRSASVFEQTFGVKLVAIGHEGRGILATIDADGNVHAHYVLRTSVYQEPMRDALPPIDDLAAAAVSAGEAALQRQLAA